MNEHHNGETNIQLFAYQRAGEEYGQYLVEERRFTDDLVAMQAYQYDVEAFRLAVTEAQPTLILT